MNKGDIVAVIGAGMGGKGILATLGIAGYRLRSRDIVEAQIAGMRVAGGLHVEGRPQSFAPVELATTDLAAAVNGASTILVSIYGRDHPALARELAPLLADGQTIVLMQGHFGGALAFDKALREAGCRTKFDLCEMDGYPYMLEVLAPDRVELQTDKAFYQLSSVPASRAGELVQRLKVPFPGLRVSKSWLDTAFADFGGILHTGAMITNVGRVEGGVPYNFYAATMTPSVCALIEAMDAERIAVAKEYGVETIGAARWLEETYGRTEPTLHEKLQANALSHYRSSPAPLALGHRFFMSDVPCFLVPLTSLARLAGVATPVLDSMITVAGGLARRDFRAEGRTLEALGLAGKSRSDIMLAAGYRDVR
jgi:opine dehydrogenase